MRELCIVLCAEMDRMYIVFISERTEEFYSSTSLRRVRGYLLSIWHGDRFERNWA